MADPVTLQLIAILRDAQLALDRGEETQQSYENPNWAYKQAHKNGARSSLKLIENLINI
jgi:hypothetical protein